MNLTSKPEIVQFPKCHYVFNEKIGPFQETAMKAWQQLHTKTDEINQKCGIKGGMSLYKVHPQMIYRAGHTVERKPDSPIEGFQYMEFDGGKYAKFTLKGSYGQLPEASGKVMAMVKEQKLAVRDGFFIENYVNNPKSTPEAELITEILIPVQ